MTGVFKLIITTPEKTFFNREAESIIVTSEEGEMGILPSHVPMVVALQTAPIRILEDAKWRNAAVSGAFAQISDSSVVIIADTAEWEEDIELARAVEAKKRAEERLQYNLSEVEYWQSQVALQRALARIKVKDGK